eukprot:2162037-Prymnesium_polylepis.2
MCMRYGAAVGGAARWTSSARRGSNSEHGSSKEKTPPEVEPARPSFKTTLRPSCAPSRSTAQCSHADDRIKHLLC